MNLVLNVNSNLHSVKGSSEGEQKIHSAIAEAMESIKTQAVINAKRVKKGQKPLPYNAVVKDEYGKDLVTIKETRSLEEIRQAYKKSQEEMDYEVREKNLLKAMDEIGNSSKSEQIFKDDLKETLNSALFVTDAKLTPGLEQILDYFGDSRGLVNSINFKEDISAKCIRDLIDMPDPKTGKPPKSFEQLMSNVVSINRIFRENPNRDKYLEITRNYIKIRYNKIVPGEYKQCFESKEDLQKLIGSIESEKAKNEKVESLEFKVSEKNFKKYFQSFSKLEQFKNKPSALASYLMQRVPAEGRESFTKWMHSVGCTDSVSTIKVLTKWTNEAEKNQSKDMGKSAGKEPKKEASSDISRS